MAARVAGVALEGKSEVRSQIAEVKANGVGVRSCKHKARPFRLARAVRTALVFGVMLAGVLTATGWAQLEVGSNTSMTLTGDIGFG